ncbi:MAG: alpha-1,2-fucosyltransferase [Candidatus Mcinerneyibacterium aminivorans]|uniref:Alpha-1,2-fucosyltransferase n=1 Tax=Candidatus Mcinerneyibacterium aminivorans TaxID=2703815 RepID=A0A5D0MDV7_9BACT|nr:MAG: alpha-1,2-fucosyltransferase [Candidatus Mcinerneyibacterium aminivorans]
MIIVKLKGGLGNQMFQYATGKAVSILNNTELKLDKKWYSRNKKQDTYRKYSLNIFNLNPEFATQYDIVRIKTKDIFYNLGSFLFLKKGKRFYLKERKDTFEKTILNRKEAYLDGYWQSYKYFSGIKDSLHKDFKMNIKLTDENRDLKNEIENSESVAVHVRRGDYISNEHIRKIFNVCDLNYYRKAMSYVSNNKLDPIFYIFSNDIKWTKKKFNNEYNLKFVEGNDAKVDFYLMKKCKNNIIANSSFSWWPAYLNRNKKKIVVAPKTWFKSENRSSENRVPENWIRL